jgi:CheY-like chemotaxis protein
VPIATSRHDPQARSFRAEKLTNLLGVILSSAAMVSEKVTTAVESDDNRQWTAAQYDIGAIQLAGERAAALTRQLLTYGRPEAIQPQVVDINEVVSDVQDLLRSTIGGQVAFVVSLQPDLWPVLADPGRLGEVLLSLVENAREAMPDGGVLTLDTANLVVDEEYSTERLGVKLGRAVRLRIGATGTGLPADVHEHVFDPFSGGTAGRPIPGLGLPAIHRIVTEAGGHIQLYSQPGMGTTFTILLPVTDHDAETAPDPVSGLAAPSGQTVLLVEDHRALRAVTERMLSRNGYQVIAAASGTDAIQRAHDHEGEIHLLLTDVVMPEMFGKEVAARIREVRPNIAVLYMSGYPQPVLTFEGRLEPGVTLLEKPFSEAELVSKAGRVLGNVAGFTTVEGPGAR